jgi:hypothetical protein
MSSHDFRCSACGEWDISHMNEPCPGPNPAEADRQWTHGKVNQLRRLLRWAAEELEGRDDDREARLVFWEKVAPDRARAYREWLAEIAAEVGPPENLGGGSQK